jgi:hypothetical protein
VTKCAFSDALFLWRSRWLTGTWQGGAQSETFVGGSQQLSTGLAKRAVTSGARIVRRSYDLELTSISHSLSVIPQDYETVVTQVHREGEDAVVVRTETGRTYRAAAAVLALSPSVCWCWGYLVSFSDAGIVAQLMQKFSFSPPLPPRRIQVCPSFPVCLSVSFFVMSRPISCNSAWSWAACSKPS